MEMSNADGDYEDDSSSKAESSLEDAGDVGDEQPEEEEKVGPTKNIIASGCYFLSLLIFHSLPCSSYNEKVYKIAIKDSNATLLGRFVLPYQ